MAAVAAFMRPVQIQASPDFCMEKGRGSLTSTPEMLTVDDLMVARRWIANFLENCGPGRLPVLQWIALHLLTAQSWSWWVTNKQTRN